MTAYGPPLDDAERIHLADLTGHAFGGTNRDDFLAWQGVLGHENLRVYRAYDDDRIVAGLGLVPMGQFFGGRSVEMVGVAGVATASVERGKGFSVAVLKQALHELHERGVALSGLYPASYTLYRKNGYEIAGSAFSHSMDVRGIDVRDRTLHVRELTPDDDADIVALYHSVATANNGNLDRGPYIWHRIRTRMGKVARGFGVFERGAMVGYVFMRLRRNEEFRYDVILSDVCAKTVAAWRRILTLLYDHGSLGLRVRWSGALNDPMTQLVAEEIHALDKAEPWMLRIVDVARALGARGYFRGLTTELHLHVDDPTLPDNTGLWLLSLSGGIPTVTRGGVGDLRLDVRALAQLYSGFMTASELARLGRVSGGSGIIAAADDVFRGPSPWMADHF